MANWCRRAARYATITGAVVLQAAVAAAQGLPGEPRMAYRGAWGYGPAGGVAAADGMVYFGAGAMLQVAKADPPEAMEVVGGVLLRGVIRDIEVVGEHLVVVTTTPGLQVVDVGDATSPRLVASMDVPWSGLNVGLGGDGWIAVAAGDDGLRLVDVTDLHRPLEMAALNGIGTTREVEVRGGYAFVAAGESLRVVDVTDPGRPMAVAELWTGLDGFDVAFSGGLLVLIGTTPPNPWGTSFSNMGMVDVSDPEQPLVLGQIHADLPFEGVVVLDRWAVVTPISVLIDLSDPCAPEFATYLVDPGIFTVPVVVGDVAFEAGSWSGLRALGVSHLPRMATIAEVPTPWRSDRVAAGNGNAYILAEEDLLRVVELAPVGEVTERGAIRLVEADQPLVDGSSLFLVKDRDTLVAFDIGQAPLPRGLGSIRLDLGYGIAMYVVDSDRAFLATVSDGMIVVDVSDPTRLQVLAHARERAHRVVARGDTAVTVDGSAGGPYSSLVRVWDVSHPQLAIQIGSVEIEEFPFSTAFVMDGESTVYLAGYELLLAVDVSNPVNPEVVWTTDEPLLHWLWLEVMDRLDVMIVVTRGGRILVFDITERAAPELVQELETAWYVSDVAAHGSTLVVAEERLLEVFEVTDTGMVRQPSR